MKGATLRISRIIWFDEIIAKLDAKHSVHQQEVTELLANKPRFRFVEKGHRPGEKVYAALGRTHAGRHLITFFVHKADGSALILSGRNMTPAERKRYEKK